MKVGPSGHFFSEARDVIVVSEHAVAFAANFERSVVTYLQS
jgi:hypothetical protein